MTKPLFALLAVLFAAVPFVPSPAAAQLRPSRRPVGTPAIPSVSGRLDVRIAYPPAGSAVTARDSTFVFGSVGNGAARLTIDGRPVPVAPNGAFCPRTEAMGV